MKVRLDFIEKLSTDQRLEKKLRDLPKWISGRKVFQTEGPARAKS